MGTMTRDSSSRIDRLVILINRMPARQQKELEIQLNKMPLLMKAGKLKKSIEKNDITIKDIVEEVKKVRHGE